MELSIQERLKDLRVERGLTLEQLAEQTHLSKSALGSYEGDNFKDISHYALIELAKFYEVTVDYLLGLTPEKLARAEHEYKVDRIHRLFGLDKKLVDKYMRMGYASHQVKRAMFLARHCDKSVEELLAMKTRQQKWGDICEQLGLPRDACMK